MFNSFGDSDVRCGHRRGGTYPGRQAQRRAGRRPPGRPVGARAPALAERDGLDPALVDDVIWGCVSQVGEQTLNIGRNAVLAAGWPESVPGTTVDRQCGSSQQAVHFAAAACISGQYDLAVAGGVESMTRVPMGASVGQTAATRTARSVLERVRRRRSEPGRRRRDDRRALGPRPRRSSTSSRSARTRRPPPRRTRALRRPDRRPSGSGRQPGDSSTRASAAAARSRSSAKLKPAFKDDGVIHRRQRLADLRRLRRRC